MSLAWLRGEALGSVWWGQSALTAPREREAPEMSNTSGALLQCVNTGSQVDPGCFAHGFLWPGQKGEQL